MSKNKIYVVTMYRWGERKNHSYLIGVFSKKQKAIDMADKEERDRGGKYLAEIVETEINAVFTDNGNIFKDIHKIK